MSVKVTGYEGILAGSTGFSRKLRQIMSYAEHSARTFSQPLKDTAMNTVIPPQSARQTAALRKLHAEAALERFPLNIQMALRLVAAVAKRRAEHQKRAVQNATKKTEE